MLIDRWAVRCRTSVSPAAFARLAGGGLRLVASGARTAPTDGSAGPAPAAGPAPGPHGLGVPELVAEVVLLQARPDWFQTRPSRLGERGTGSADQG
ncbi:hypothetical protein [Streptomyces olivochromogenes]|uniref:hypothetical protein n=1 Tax=Streptomyces olivochromogenes TaxID=1963 RepID=UPI0027E3E109|nr:hypothetical protein [Streptomyces olivochromogenes]MCF3137154.1 hypothetical protein [Streptomyces olivochromogenes]